MEKRVSIFKLSIFIIFAGLFDGFFTYFIAEILKIPLFLDTIGILTITFLFGGIPGLITALFSQFFSELIGGYLDIWIYIYVLCSFSAVGIVCIFKKSINQAHSKLSIVIILFISSILMCFAISIIGGIINMFSDFFAEQRVGNIQTDYYKLSLLKMSISGLPTNILCRFPVNIIDRPISVFAAYGCSLGLKKLLKLK